MGADVAAQLESWKRPERVLELARLGIAGRPGTVLDDAEAMLERLGADERAEIVRMREIARLLDPDQAPGRAGRAGALPGSRAVAELIAERGLYREAVPA